MKAYQALSLALVLLLAASAALGMPRASAGKLSDRDSLIRTVLEQGEALIAKVPNPVVGSNVRGYLYRRNFDSTWQLVCIAMDALQFNIPEVFKSMTGTGRLNYILTSAIAMCSTSESVEWINPKRIQELVDSNDLLKDYSKFIRDDNNYQVIRDRMTKSLEEYQRRKEVFQVRPDELPPVTYEDIETLEDLRALGKAMNKAGKVVNAWDDICEYMNTMQLLNGLDLKQMNELAVALSSTGNADLRKAANMLRTFSDYTGDTRSFVTFLNGLAGFGVDQLLSKLTGQLVSKVVGGTVGAIYNASILAINWMTGVSSLTNIAYDMSYAFEITDACWNDFRIAKQYNYEANKERFFEGEDREQLIDSFEEAIYCGINMAEAAANMEEVFAKFVKTADGTLTGGTYINQAVKQAAANASENVDQYRQLADDLRNILGLFRWTLEADFSDVWVRHWEMLNHPEHTLDITRNDDDTLHLKAHFEGADDFECDFDPYDYETVNFDSDSSPIYGTLLINASGRLEVYLYSNDADRDDPLFPYLMYAEDGVMYGVPQIYITANPPDIGPYGGPHQDPAFYDDLNYGMLTPEQTREVFQKLSQRKLIAAGGAGAWAGELRVRPDGTFTGYYYDEDADTVYSVDFSGRFSADQAERRGATACALWVEEVTTAQTPGTLADGLYGQTIEYDSAPLYERDYVLVTLPGTPDEDIPEMVRGEISGTYDVWENYANFTTLTRGDGWGFFSNPDLWQMEDLEPVATATPRPTNMAPVLDAPVGSTITFGHYEQDGNTTNVKEPIEWLVLDVQCKSALVISKYGLDSQPYNETRSEITWADCSLRSWLNDVFAYDAFTDAERDSILLTTVINNRSQVYNEEFAANTGPDTLDKVFLLSYAEAKQYFKKDKDRIIEITNYAYQQRRLKTGNDVRVTDWWLRTPYYDQKKANIVYYGGSIEAGGAVEDVLAVRPAMWISLDTIGRVPVATQAPDPTPVPRSYRIDGKILVDDDICTIVNLGKRMGGGDIPEYRLAVINHTKDPLDFSPDYLKDATVDGRKASIGGGILTIAGTDTFSSIPVGAVAETSLWVYGSGYGYTSIDQLVNVEIPVQVHRGADSDGEYWSREYTLRMDQGPSYIFPEATGYITGETTSFTFEIPDNWRITYSPYPETYRYTSCAPPPSLGFNFSSILEVQEDGQGYQSFDEMLKQAKENREKTIKISSYTLTLDGTSARAIRQTYTGDSSFAGDINEWIYLTDANGTESRIHFFTRSSDADVFTPIYEHFLSSIRFKEGGADSAPAAEEPADQDQPAANSWAGCWATRDTNTVAEMLITDSGNGTLSARMYFAPVQISWNVVLVSGPDGGMRFETENRSLTGQIVMEEDGSLHLNVTGGTIMEDEEATEYQGYFAQAFVFYPAVEDTLWMRAASDGGGSIADWLGDWTIVDGLKPSTIHISKDGDYINFILTVGNTRHTGQAERMAPDELYLMSDDVYLDCLLLLNRLQRRIAILVLDVGAESDNEIYDLFEHSMVVVYQKDSGSPAFEIPENKQQKGETAYQTLPPSDQTAQENSLLPIPGNTGCLQVPVSRVDATSYIEGKNDRTAYMPFRMTDGEETTAYQFSTRTTKPGKAYLYFEFDEPVDVDQLWIKNGFWKITDGNDQYTRNSRIKKMTVDYLYDGRSNYGVAQTFTLKDDKKRADWAKVNLKAKQKVTAVRVRIDSIYQGSKFKNDVCVSEIMFVHQK